MHEPFAVCGRERAPRVRQPGEARGKRRARVADRLAQRATVDQLHYDVRHALVLAHVENRDRVRVIQGRRSACLPHQARAGFRRGQVLGDHLERDTPTEARILCPVNAPHAPLSERGLDRVAFELGSGLEHRGRSIAGTPRGPPIGRYFPVFRSYER